MIPSRPLSLSEIIRETFFIYFRTFSRYLLLLLVLWIPGLLIVTYGSTIFVEQAVSAAHHDIDFSDRDLTAIRNEMHNWLTVHDPLLVEEEQLLQQSDTSVIKPDSSHVATDTNHVAPDTNRVFTNDTAHAVMQSSETNSQQTERVSDRVTTSQFIYYISTDLAKFSSSIILVLLGGIVLLFGMCSLVGSLIDLACQVFEEHRPSLTDAGKAVISKYAWSIGLLFIIYVVAISAADGFVALLDQYSPTVAGFISSLLTIAQIYLMVRLSLTISALISEECGPFVALQRSWHLTRHSGWRIFGYSVIFGAIIMIALLILSIVSGLAVSGTLIPWFEAFLSRPQINIAWFVSSFHQFSYGIVIYFGILFIPIFALLPIFGTVFYYDLRTRQEGPLVYLDE